MPKTVPPGGPATSAGIYYQMLLTLLEVTSLDLAFPAGETTLQWTLEPSNGGDLEGVSDSSRKVYQAKTRSTANKWSLKEIVTEVLPDFLREEPLPTTRYVFVTDGKLGDLKLLKELGQSLLGEAVTTSGEGWYGGVAALKGQEPKSSHEPKQGKQKQPRRRQEIPQTPTSAEDFTNRLIEVLINKMQGPSYPKPGPTLLRDWLAILLNHLEFKSISVPDLESELFDRLENLGVTREGRRDHLNSLVGELTRLARSGDLKIQRGSVLRDSALPLRFWKEIRDRSYDLIEASLEALGFDASLDVRNENLALGALLRDGKPSKTTATLIGGSGVGKTWMLASAIRKLVQLRLQPALVFVHHEGDLSKDLTNAAQKFCEFIWQVDNALTFEVLSRKVTHLARLDDPTQPWLIIFVDGVTKSGYITEARSKELTEKGVSIVIAETTEDTERQGPTDYRVNQFTPKQVLAFLERALGKSFQPPPPDVVDLIRCPILAKVYVDIARGEPSWQPTSEYELIERHWLGFAQSADRMASLQQLESLACGLLEGEIYPWPASRLTEVGISGEDYKSFLSSGLLTASADRRTVRIWHDRVLEWAIAEGLVHAWARQAGALDDKPEESECVDAFSEVLRTRVAIAAEPASNRGRYVYVAYDVLWLLLSEATDQRLKAAVTLLTDYSPRHHHNFPTDSIDTLGERLVPALHAWVLSLPPSDYFSAPVASDLGEVAAKIESSTTRSTALHAICSCSIPAQIFGLEILARQPNEKATNKILELHALARKIREKKANVKPDNQGPEFFLAGMHKQLWQSLILSLAGQPNKHEGLLLDSPDDAEFELLLDILSKVPGGPQIWSRHSKLLLRRSTGSSQAKRFAAFCIYSFLDRSGAAKSWLLDQANSRSFFAEGSMARLALWSCFRARPPLPADSENDPIWFLISWWPTRVLLSDSDDYAALLREVGQILRCQRALALMPIRSSSGDLAFAQALLGEVAGELNQLTEELARKTTHPNRYILFDRLIENLDSRTLRLLWSHHSNEFEAALTRYIIALAPNEIESSCHCTIDQALELFIILAGPHIDEVAEFALNLSKDYYCLLRVFRVLERSCSLQNALKLRAVAAKADLLVQEHKSPQTRSLAIQMNSLKILGHHKHWNLAIPLILKLDLDSIPRDLESIAAEEWDDLTLAPVLEALRTDSFPGALLALGLSGRKDTAKYCHRVLLDSHSTPPCVEAAWLALDLLNDDSPTTLDPEPALEALPGSTFCVTNLP